MTLMTKFNMEAPVRHRLTEYEGYVTGIVVRPSHTEYEVQQITDSDGSWRDAKWIDERYLELK